MLGCYVAHVIDLRCGRIGLVPPDNDFDFDFDFGGRDLSIRPGILSTFATPPTTPTRLRNISTQDASAAVHVLVPSLRFVSREPQASTDASLTGITIMVARKRGRDEMEEEQAEEPSMLQKLRSMWQFANLAQYIFFFKGALKIDDDFGIEVRICAACAHGCTDCDRGALILTMVQDLETECLKPQPSEKLASIGLALLKHVSSQKGLTYVYHPTGRQTSTDIYAGLKYSTSTRAASLWPKHLRATPSEPTRPLSSSIRLMSTPRYVCYSSCLSGR